MSIGNGFAQSVNRFEQNPRLAQGFKVGLVLAVMLFVFLGFSIMVSNVAHWSIYFVLVILSAPVLTLVSVERLMKGLKEWHMQDTPLDQAPVGRTGAQKLRDDTRRLAVVAGIGSGLAALALGGREGAFAPSIALMIISAACWFFAICLWIAIPDADKSRRVQAHYVASRAASPVTKRREARQYWKEGVIVCTVILFLLARLANEIQGVTLPTSQVGQSVAAGAMLVGIAVGAVLYGRWRHAFTKKSKG